MERVSIHLLLLDSSMVRLMTFSTRKKCLILSFKCQLSEFSTVVTSKKFIGSNLTAVKHDIFFVSFNSIRLGVAQ